MNGERDHVYRLAPLPPNFDLSRFVNSLKTTKSRLIRKAFAAELNQIDRQPVLWSRSYCILLCGRWRGGRFPTHNAADADARLLVVSNPTEALAQLDNRSQFTGPVIGFPNRSDIGVSDHEHALSMGMEVICRKQGRSGITVMMGYQAIHRHL